MPSSDSKPPSMPSPVERLATWLASAGGAGHSPVAPGTAGSAVGLLLFWPLATQPLLVQGTATLLVFLVGVWASTRLARRLGRKDPGLAVIDEVAGQWVTLLGLPLTPWTAAAGFFLFRVCDVVKPWPARSLEELPEGWGIMADDVAAGLYAHLLLRVGLLLFPQA